MLNYCEYMLKHWANAAFLHILVFFVFILGYPTMLNTFMALLAFVLLVLFVIFTVFFLRGKRA